MRRKKPLLKAGEEHWAAAETQRSKQRMVIGYGRDVRTRSLEYECGKRLSAREVENVQEVTCNLLGPGGMSDEKTRWKRSFDMIGWYLDLDTQRVTIARKNVLHAIYGFFLVGDSQVRVPIRTFERLASWGSRYSEICVGMKPYVNVLYAAYKGCGRRGSMYVSTRLREVYRMFQVRLVLSEVEELEFSRPFHTFAARTGKWTVAIECDASLTGGGGMIMVLNEDDAELVVGCFTVDLGVLGLGTDDSSYVAEWVWAIYRIQWVSDEHLAGKLNVRADKLSRGVSWERMQEEHPELRGVPLHRGEDDDGVARLLQLCDPRRSTADSDTLLAEEWRAIRALLIEEETQ
jgi:hypothetical protein